MSYAMDKAMMALSLEEENKPFDMPNLLQFKSSERNSRSLIRRILNPDIQKMSGLIHDMPRKWQKQGRIRNLPVNYYTKEVITELGEKILGEVLMVAFDPDRPQIQDYVRVKVRFDVSKPLRKTKVINLPEGGSVELRFNYERIQKRCYECQRLNHERDVCPLVVKKRRDAASERRARIIQENRKKELIIGEDDPLFGVLSEDQVGICKTTGREKIATEVLDEMRMYLRMASEEDKAIKIDRVRSSVADAEKDPITQKTMLRLEAAPIFTNQVDRGKGIVFDLDLNSPAQTKA
ncbi:uncharacterized protein LOC108820017 [Raphanus sativus]|uniref:Uncharacterized protein LOC108820017 n=1 Tax=Raphanus sativus TaxID=3726 RepID=A0A6J0KKV7_RAPSA|nr:uncharacterized protein LOC108820017 [Raphanus sativus]